MKQFCSFHKRKQLPLANILTRDFKNICLFFFPQGFHRLETGDKNMYTSDGKPEGSPLG